MQNFKNMIYYITIQTDLGHIENTALVNDHEPTILFHGRNFFLTQSTLKNILRYYTKFLKEQLFYLDVPDCVLDAVI